MEHRVEMIIKGKSISILGSLCAIKNRDAVYALPPGRYNANAKPIQKGNRPQGLTSSTNRK
jgi:hypothetical protein